MSKQIAVIFPCPDPEINDRDILAQFDPQYRCKIYYYSQVHKKKVNKRDCTLDLDKVFQEHQIVILVDTDMIRYITNLSGGVQKLNAYPYILGDNVFIGVFNPRKVLLYPLFRKKIDKAFKVAYKFFEDLENGKPLKELSVEKDYAILESEDDILKILNVCKERKCLILDIETSHLYPHEGRILGIAFGYKDHMGRYAPMEFWGSESLELLKSMVKDPNVMVICHNISFEMKWLQHHLGISVFDWKNYHDCLLLAYIENENTPIDLKSLAVQHTDLGPYEDELDKHKKTLARKMKIKLADFSYELIPIEILGPYACKDIDATAQVFKQKFRNSKQYADIYNFLLYCTPAIAQLELVGGPINMQALEDAIKNFDKAQKELKQELFSHPAVKALINKQGKEFNPNSTFQVADLFFEILELPVIKRTDSGRPSTDAEVLKKLKDMSPVVEMIEQYRKLNKFKSTYLENFKIKTSKDGRLRTSFNIARTSSGRLSSSGNINYQNIPRGKTIKSIFCAREGYKILQMDLGTAEVWVAAAESKDKFLIQAFESGLDFHSYIAKIAFNLDVPVEEIKKKFPEKRQASKAITFGILYGAQPKKIASEIGTTEREAKKLINSYFEQAYGLKSWVDSRKQLIENVGVIQSVFGRTRRVPEVFSPNRFIKYHALNSAFNFVVQSAASDINLKAFSNLIRDILKHIERDEILPWNLVHDSMIFEVRDDYVDFLVNKIALAIQKVCKEVYPHMPIPIKLDFELGDSWGSLEKYTTVESWL